MEAATLWLMYIASTGGREKRVIQHYKTEKECVEVMARWKNQARVTKAWCMTPYEYNARIGFFSTDMLDPKYRP